MKPKKNGVTSFLSHHHGWAGGIRTHRQTSKVLVFMRFFSVFEHFIEHFFYFMSGAIVYFSASILEHDAKRKTIETRVILLIKNT